ncbi:hypothetical protein KI387_021022, partial [Taxus chinensis]
CEHFECRVNMGKASKDYDLCVGNEVEEEVGMFPSCLQIMGELKELGKIVVPVTAMNCV